MRRWQLSFLPAWIVVYFFLLGSSTASLAIERQANADYHARREALAKRVAGVIVLFAATENDGPNDLYGFRQDDNFFYLSGMRRSSPSRAPMGRQA